MNIPAFPCEWDYINSSRAAANGMTLRDYFAAKAMQGVISATPAQIEIDEPHLAKWSYKMADAMMEARNVAQ